MVVGNRAGMGGSKRFWVNEYGGGGGGGLSKKSVLWPKIREKGSGFVVVLIFGDRWWGYVRVVQLMERR